MPAITTSTRPGDWRRRSSTAGFVRDKAGFVRDRADGASTATSNADETTPSARRPETARIVDGFITRKVCQPQRSARMVSIAIAINQTYDDVDMEPSLERGTMGTKS